MARNFVRTSSQYLSNANAVVTESPLSMACWFNTSEVVNSKGLISIVKTGATSQFAMQLAGDETLVAFVRNDLAQTGAAVTTATWSAGTWHLASATFLNSTSRSVYLDGANKITNTVDRTPVDLDVTLLGAINSAVGPDTFMDGDVAFPAFWNVALTDADHAMLGLGVHPKFVRPEGLVCAPPLWGRNSPEPDPVGGFDFTLVNAPAYADNPRVFMPSSGFIVPAHAAVTQTITANLRSAIQQQKALTASIGGALQHQDTTQASLSAAIQITRALTSEVEFFGGGGFEFGGGGKWEFFADATILRAAIQKQISISATIGGAIELQGIAVSANASAALATIRTHTAGLEVAISAVRTAQADLAAAVQAQRSITASARGAVQTGKAVTASVAAAVSALRSATASLNASVIIVGTAAITADLSAAIEATRTAALAVSSAVQAGRTISAGASGAIAETATVDALLSAMLSASRSLNAGLAAAVQDTMALTASLNAPVQAQRSVIVAIASAVQAAQSANAAISAAVSAIRTIGANATAAVQAQDSLTASMAAAAQIGRSAIALIDAAVQRERSIAASLSTGVALGNELGAMLAAAVSRSAVATANADAAILDTMSVSAALSAMVGTLAGPSVGRRFTVRGANRSTIVSPGGRAYIIPPGSRTQ